jgi:hypothetical protein
VPRTIPHPPRPHLARPGGTPPAKPALRPGARALASYPGLDEPGFCGDGQPAGEASP